MAKTDLNERSWTLLKLLIERYIRDGQPVASKTLADDLDLSISSATIRNVLSDLEKLGYISSPHTSAGRVPTEQGYRLFVDDLLMASSLVGVDVEDLQHQLDPDQITGNLLHNASSLLSDVTKLAGLVTVPKRNKVNFRHIEFLPLSNNRVLTILVFNQREVQNRVIFTSRNYSPSDLQQAANFINAHYVGKELLDIHKQLIYSMKTDKKNMNHMMQTVLDVASKTFDQPFDEDDYVMTGQSHLLGLVDNADLERLRSLFEAFTQKQGVLHLLDKCLQADGLQIFIGHEAGHDVFDEYSIVMAPYEVDGEVLGVLGVIGPTRMQYNRVMSTVNVTAKLLSDALEK